MKGNKESKMNENIVCNECEKGHEKKEKKKRSSRPTGSKALNRENRKRVCGMKRQPRRHAASVN